MKVATDKINMLLSNLIKENELLKNKLKEKQQCINKTNAYYKKKIYNLQPYYPLNQIYNIHIINIFNLYLHYMIYQLSNGKVIEISIEQYLQMTDEDVEYFIAYEIGDYYENPFSNSALTNGTIKEDDLIDNIQIDVSIDIDEDLLEE